MSDKGGMHDVVGEGHSDVYFLLFLARSWALFWQAVFDLPISD